jgi:hypothetical protein
MKRPGESRHEFFRRRIAELGVGQSDADYGGKIAEWVLDLSRLLRDQRHSGQSFALTLGLFDNLLHEWETPDDVPEQPTLSPAAKFEAAAQDIADAAANVNRAVQSVDGVWPNTMSAAAWAAEFVARFGPAATIDVGFDKVIDEALMVGWFANAIMAGYDRGYQKAKADALNVTIGFDPGHPEPTQAPVPVPHVAPRAKIYLPREDVDAVRKMAPAACSGCGKPIYWLTSRKTGKRMPFDALDVMMDDEGHVGVDLSKNHWATCPLAPQFRKKD